MQVQALEAEKGEKEAHVQKLEASTKEQLWAEDLDGFEAAYGVWLEDAVKQEADLAAAQLQAKARGKKGVRFCDPCLTYTSTSPRLTTTALRCAAELLSCPGCSATASDSTAHAIHASPRL